MEFISTEYKQDIDPIGAMVLRVLNKIDITAENSNENLAQLLNEIRKIEFYTIFSKRTIKYIEDSLMSNVSMLTIMLEMNMYMEAEMAVYPEIRKAVEDIITALINTINIKNYTNTILSESGQFLSQVFNDDANLQSLVMNTWYKVVVITNVYFNLISLFFNQPG